MQLVIHVQLEQALSLPLNYNHIIQSVIYRAIGSLPEYSSFMHDQGYSAGGRRYKLFNFSRLSGDYFVENRLMTFKTYMSFEVRSPEPILLRLLGQYLWENGITFGDETYKDIELELYDYTVEQDYLTINMISPVTVYTTDQPSGHTYYYGPDQEDFYNLIDENFRRKYQAYFGLSPTEHLQMSLVEGDKPKKTVTKYKGLYVTAWGGKYNLSCSRKYLDFLYQTGIGSKNGQGFGMFEIL